MSDFFDLKNSCKSFGNKTIKIVGIIESFTPVKITSFLTRILMRSYNLPWCEPNLRDLGLRFICF